MTKLEEIYRKCWEKKWPEMKYSDVCEIDHIHNAMKEYAEWYAIKYQNQIIDNCGGYDDNGKLHISYYEVLNLKLPNHEEAG